jgi:hypothetical protein
MNWSEVKPTCSCVAVLGTLPAVEHANLGFNYALFYLPSTNTGQTMMTTIA